MTGLMTPRHPHRCRALNAELTRQAVPLRVLPGADVRVDERML